MTAYTRFRVPFLNQDPGPEIRPQGIPPEMLPLPPNQMPEQDQKSAPQPPEVFPEPNHPMVHPPKKENPGERKCVHPEINK
jgi:hypothetical protein